MDRETKEFITPVAKQKVIIKAWLTGREKRELRDIMLKGVNFSVKGDSFETDETDAGEAIKKAEDKAITTVVVSIDGKKEGILNAILDMKGDDYDFVLNEVDKVTKSKDFTKP